MENNRLTIPMTSVIIAVVLGMGTAAVTLTFAHPVVQIGGIAAAGVVVGSLAFATSLSITEHRGPLQIALGGVALCFGLFVLLGAVGLAVVDVPPISVIAASFAISGAVLLSFVMIGYCNPAAVKTHEKVMSRWTVVSFGLGITLATAAGIIMIVSTGEIGNLVSTYLEGISTSLTAGAWLVFVHLIVTFFLAGIAIQQLRVLELLAVPQANSMLAKLSKAVLAVGIVLLVPVIVVQRQSIRMIVAEYSHETATLLTIMASATQIPALHLLFVLIEAMAIGVICLSLILRGVRRVSFKQVILATGYLVGPLVLTVSIVAGGILTSLVLNVDVFERLLSTSSPLPISHRITSAAWVSFALFAVLTVGLATLRFVLGWLYRFENRGLPAAASVGLFTGAAFLGFTGTWPPIVAGCLVAAILTWDTLENAVSIGEQLDGRFNAVHNEFVHLFSSGTVAGLAVVVGLGSYELSQSLMATEAPSVLVVGVLLAAAVIFALLLRRT